MCSPHTAKHGMASRRMYSCWVTRPNTLRLLGFPQTLGPSPGVGVARFKQGDGRRWLALPQAI